MSMQKIPADWRNCATCSHWCGRKMPDMLCKFVEFDNNERARCAGGGFNNGQMPGTGTCPKWERQYK
ncbi:MAG: hypothetical protein KBS60_03715 [Phascolarctobacterium sp.]|nr:hypothetical protein [Candidatus Phascolarctobacterium caballi]